MILDRNYLLHSLQELVRIDSVNPSLVPGAKGETEIVNYLAEKLRALGLKVNLLESVPKRPSVVAIYPGTGNGRSLMLNAHVDTVEVECMEDPFSATVKDGRLYGRGAYDMKGSAAAMLAAARALVDQGVELGGDLLFSFVADEEYESLGTQEVLKHYRTDAAIVTEPTQLQICLAHKGFVWLEVETLGRAAHGSRYDEGIDANMRMGLFLAELSKLEKKLRMRRGHPLVGPPSLHAAMIQGGTGLSTYAEKCTLFIERRTIPGESEAKVVAEVQKILDHLSEKDPTFKATLKTLCVREPFEVSPDAQVVQVLGQVVENVLGAAPKYMGDSPWMDAALFSAAGIETVVIGPAGQGAHSHEEWVSIESVEKLAAILAHTAIKYCQ
ncbi:MAG: ArgE/DapE family deacylase [Calditrichaeota bacterium]|nr:MAG: ArgE/DapE family deacylase [Calditrichota bacterium]